MWTILKISEVFIIIVNIKKKLDSPLFHCWTDIFLNISSHVLYLHTDMKTLELVRAENRLKMILY